MVRKRSNNLAGKTKDRRLTLKDCLAMLSAPNQSLSDIVDRLGYPKIMQMLDRGVNDFSFATKDCCLSLIMAARYMGIISVLETMQDQYFHPAPRLIKKYRVIHENLKNDLTDILNIYKKLKTNPKGLNLPILQAYENDNPSAKLTRQFQMMDAHLVHKPNFSCPALGIKSRDRNG